MLCFVELLVLKGRKSNIFQLVPVTINAQLTYKNLDILKSKPISITRW